MPATWTSFESSSTARQASSRNPVGRLRRGGRPWNPPRSCRVSLGVRGPLAAVLAGGVLCCGSVAERPALLEGTTTAATRTSVVASSAATVVPSSELTWSPKRAGEPWYSIPFLPVDSWNPYG